MILILLVPLTASKRNANEENLHKTTIWRLLICITAALAVNTEGGLSWVQAGDDPDALLNYSFAVWVGSGVYRVAGAEKRFAVLRAPFAYTFRPAQYDKPVCFSWRAVFSTEWISLKMAVRRRESTGSLISA